MTALLFFMPNDEILLQQVILPNIFLRRFMYRTFFVINEILKFWRKFNSWPILEIAQKSIESGRIQSMALPYKSAVAILDQRTNKLVTLIKLPIRQITQAIYNPLTKSIYFGSIGQHAIYRMKFDL